jgi:hypothetical protein
VSISGGGVIQETTLAIPPRSTTGQTPSIEVFVRAASQVAFTATLGDQKAFVVYICAG